MQQWQFPDEGYLNFLHLYIYEWVLKRRLFKEGRTPKAIVMCITVIHLSECSSSDQGVGRKHGTHGRLARNRSRDNSLNGDVAALAGSAGGGRV